MTVQEVAVAGGGIGGLAAVIALRHAGIAATAYERAPDLARVQVGGGLQMWPNALRALRQLGCGDAVEERAWRVDGVRFLNWRGRQLSYVDARPVAQRVGASAFNVKRAALHAVLADAAAEWIQTDREVTRYTNRSDDVEVAFADGSTVTADLLLGADGIRSRVRAQMHGDTPPEYAKISNWSGTLRYEHPKIPSRYFTFISGRGKRVIIYYVGDGEMIWYCDLLTQEQEAGSGSRKKAVLAEFAQFADPVPDIIASTPDEVITRSAFYWRPPLDRWTDGRVLLVGDAAHAMLPNLAQGACQAIEDGVALGKILSRPGSLSAALAEFEGSRMPRTNRLVKRSAAIGRLWHTTNPVFSEVRDAVMQVFGKPMAKADEKDWAHEV